MRPWTHSLVRVPSFGHMMGDGGEGSIGRLTEAVKGLIRIGDDSEFSEAPILDLGRYFSFRISSDSSRRRDLGSV